MERNKESLQIFRLCSKAYYILSSVLFSDDEVYEDDSSKAKKAKEGAESVKGQPQEAEAGEKKKRPPKVYANRTLTSFSKSPTKQKRQLTNKKVSANYQIG